MKLEITGTAKEIAALVMALQERQKEFVPTHGYKLETYEEAVDTGCVPNRIDKEQEKYEALRG